MKKLNGKDIMDNLTKKYAVLREQTYTYQVLGEYNNLTIAKIVCNLNAELKPIIIQNK